MKIYIVGEKTLRALFIAFTALLCILILISFSRSKTLSVFSQDKELPIYSVDTAEKKASITFDCAWGAADIPDILETLEKEKVTATFFIVGQWAEKYPEAVKSIALKGHDVANHSYSHLRMGALDKARAVSEIKKCGEKLGELTGNKIDLFRAPYGDYSNSLISTAKSLGYHTIQWSVDSLDWKPGISSETIMNRINEKMKPGSIILFHNDTQLTAKLLPRIIRNLKAQGYSLVPVSGLIMKDGYIIDFEGRQKKK